MLSYRLLWFERDGAGEFKPPEQFPREALVAVSTHDLPTLAGWWEGDDLALRARLGLYPDESVHARRSPRAPPTARACCARSSAGSSRRPSRRAGSPPRCTPTSPQRPRA